MNVNHKLELLDQLDDAAFALMMDEYAEAEGERLRAEFEADMRAGLTPPKPEGLDEKCRKQIKAEYGKARWAEYGARARKMAVKAAAMVLIGVGIAAATVMSVEAIREPFWRFITEEYNVRTDFDFNDISKNKDTGFIRIDPIETDDPVFTFVPEGYRCVSFETLNGRINSRYESTDGKYINFSMFFYQNDSVVETIEDEYNKYVTLLDKKALCRIDPSSPEDSQFIEMHWDDPEIETKYMVTTNGMDESKFILFCEHIVKTFRGLSIDKPSVVPDALQEILPAEYEQQYSRSSQGLLFCCYQDGEKQAIFSMHNLSGTMSTYIQNPIITEHSIAGYEATVMNGGDEIGTLWSDEERELVFYFTTLYMSEEEHLLLCEQVAEYYKGVTLPVVSTVIYP